MQLTVRSGLVATMWFEPISSACRIFAPDSPLTRILDSFFLLARCAYRGKLVYKLHMQV